MNNKTDGKAPAANVRVPFDKGTPYTCPELKAFAARPGAMDAFRLPSLQGSERIYLRQHVKEADHDQNQNI